MLKTLDDLYLHMLKDVYHAEKQVSKLLPKVIKAVSDEELSDLLEQDREQVSERVEAIEAAFEALGKRPRAIACDAMLGLVEEASGVLEEAEGDAMDAGLLAAIQAIKHYEITRFGTLAAWASRTGNTEASDAFHLVVASCKEADEQMTEIAESQVNKEANEDGDSQSKRSSPKNSDAKNSKNKQSHKERTAA